MIQKKIDKFMEDTEPVVNPNKVKWNVIDNDNKISMNIIEPIRYDIKENGIFIKSMNKYIREKNKWEEQFACKVKPTSIPDKDRIIKKMVYITDGKTIRY